MTAVVTADILVKSAQCAIQQLSDSCTYLNDTYSIRTPRLITWLAVLATRRDVFFTPTTNCMGYLLNKRTDQGVDTNRDFPYGRRDNNCMRSVTARVVNSIMKNNIIQVYKYLCVYVRNLYYILYCSWY